MTNPPQAVRMHGVLSPVVTPFDRELRPDGERLVKHCRWLLEQGVGLAVFGTNSEANSMSVAEKIALLDTLVAAGIPTARLMPGTGASAFPDTVELTRYAVQLGCAGTLAGLRISRNQSGFRGGAAGRDTDHIGALRLR